MTPFTDAAGALYLREVDIDSGEEVRSVRLPHDRQPLKVRYEEAMDESYQDWRRWKDTRVEAQARGVAAAVITVLTNRENVSWGAYVASINKWRAAP
ncbi:MAG: hypothetical protein ACR2NO_05690 [Chloroflexota bacterium]